MTAAAYGVEKRYGSLVAVAELSFESQEGEILGGDDRDPPDQAAPAAISRTRSTKP
jgi:hypothetical protein